MSYRRCTIDDVARAVGVSSMTVSRAMRGVPGLSEETRKRVIEAAERLGYRPSTAARALATRCSTSLAIVMPDMANPFFAILAKAATDVARSAGRSVFIMNTDEDPALELAALESLKAEQIAGIIVAGSRIPESRLHEAVADFKTVVLINRDCSGPGRGCVNVLDREGAAQAVEYLASIGRRRIALIAGPRNAAGARRRLAGYRDGLKRSGLAFDSDCIVSGTPTIEGGVIATHTLFKRISGIDAILAYNDLVAIGALRALEERGISVPRDVAVMGTDDVPYAAITKPALTTVRADIPRLGADAMRLLLALEGREKTDPVEPQVPTIVIRESA